MSHLLKRTKKSCLKLLRKISTSRQLFAQKLEEDELSTCHVEPPPSNTYDALGRKRDAPETTTEINTESFNEINTVQYNPDNDTDAESVQNSFDENQNNAIIHGLTAKFFLGADGYEFQRLQQLRSDAASEVFDFETDEQPELIMSGDVLAVHFEKVHYRQNVRYLRHTPSSSSLDLHTMAAPSSLVTDVAATPVAHIKLHNHQNESFMQQRAPRSCSISLGSKVAGSYHNVVITAPVDSSIDAAPVIKWDINGNSLDDDYDINDDLFVFRRNHWTDDDDDFDSKWNRLHDKRLAQLAQRNVDSSQKSSHQSSACTLETWLDGDLEHFEQQSVLNEKFLPHCNLCLK